MAKNAQNTGVLMPFPGQIEAESTQNGELKPWHRLPDESPRWYLRFRMYTLLGFQRSLQAAVQVERMEAEDEAAPNSPKNADFVELQERISALDRQITASQRNLSIKEKAIRIEVPGSWKEASARYRWVERARAYDLWVQEERRRRRDEALHDAEFADATYRILILDRLARAVLALMQNEARFKESLILVARLQSIMRDIRNEMKSLGKL
jgi:hypothetical protein